MKIFKGVQEDELISDDFERPFKKKYLSKRYYDAKDKEFYGLQIGSMTDDEYNRRFLELLSYVPSSRRRKPRFKDLVGFQ